MLNQNELKNVLVFLTAGKWSLNVQEANELVHLTKKLTQLTTEVATEKVEEVKPTEGNGTN